MPVSSSRPVRVGEDLVDVRTGANRQQPHSGGERFGHQVTGFGVMLEAEQVPQFVSQNGEQIHSASRCTVGLEFGIVIRSYIGEPAEAGGSPNQKQAISLIDVPPNMGLDIQRERAFDA